VAQVSFRWKQFHYLFNSLSTRASKRRVGSPLLSQRQLKTLSSWFLCLLGIVTMGFWNWKLLLATVAGVSLMLGVYLLQGYNWQGYWLDLQRFWQGSHRKLTIAVGSGGIGAIMTYLAAAIWSNAENRWLATGAILQGLATMLTLGLLAWQAIASPHYRDSEKFAQLLQDLTETEPLKRLIAVRRLTHFAEKTRLNATEIEQLRQYFRLMLSQETQAIICEAILDCFTNNSLSFLR
jgi:hypothetical protein